MKKYWWISWYQPTDDVRPLNYPPGENVLGWWNSGTRCQDNAGCLVAQVRADSESQAKEEIAKDWPEADEWRFCDETDKRAPNDRFPLSDWMEKRFQAA